MKRQSYIVSLYKEHPIIAGGLTALFLAIGVAAQSAKGDAPNQAPATLAAPKATPAGTR